MREAVLSLPGAAFYISWDSADARKSDLFRVESSRLVVNNLLITSYKRIPLLDEQVVVVCAGDDQSDSEQPPRPLPSGCRFNSTT